MKTESALLPLPVVDGLELDERLRRVLRPGELMADGEGRLRRLPRFFYEVPSWEAANEIRVVPNFLLAELIRVDVREAAPQRDFPRYVPLAITALAVHLELFRRTIDEPVYLAANGGYRSPSHRLTRHASPHCWGTAANIFRIGGEMLNDRERIERFNQRILEVLPGAWVRPHGRGKGFADDHVHLDLGYLAVVPRDAAGEVEPDDSLPEDAGTVTEGTDT
jgi:hypothetical protein